MRNFLLLTILFSFCFSCRPFIDKPPEGWPVIESRPLRGIRGFPAAKGNYGIGFRDGCGMAWDAVTKGLTSDIMPKDLKPELAANNADYQLGWFDGFEQCTYVVDWDVV
jgi:hypothetical protein